MKSPQKPKRGRSFLKVLMEYDPSLKKMRPKEIRVFNVNANYGSYQVRIGPEYSPLTCRQLGTAPHSRPIEIHGELHHLFIEDGDHVSAMPSPKAIDNNLKGTVIIKGLAVHLQDANGNGEKLTPPEESLSPVEARERINLAGENGDRAMAQLEQTGRLAKETYRIIQYDIMHVTKMHAKHVK